jgi:hypothetical protein
MRVRGAVVGLTVAAVLAGCATAPTSGPSNTPSEPSTPVVEVAPVGEAAIPLGCADLLEVADVAGLGTGFEGRLLDVAIDENRIAIDLSVSRLQLGDLHCVWADRYGASDFNSYVELWIGPSTATLLDPAAEQGWSGPLTPIPGYADALIACSEGSITSSDDPTLYNSCEVVDLRGGYRIELDTVGLRAAPGQDLTVATALLAKVDAAVSSAGPARVVEPVEGASSPWTVCTAPELTPVFEYLGVDGAPTISANEYYPGVTDCVWASVDEYGNQAGPFVSVIPGGAWAITRMATGVSTFWIPTRPSSDGTYVVGVGDGMEAWRAIGDDLVRISSYRYDAVDGWEAFLESVW